MVKAQLRVEARRRRAAVLPAIRAAETAAAVACCLGLLDGEPVSYAAYGDELDLEALHTACWSRGLVVLLPRVLPGSALAWHRVSNPKELIPGAFGIREPDPARAPECALPRAARVFTPGLAFTRDGRRLGQGGGYYDRLLAARPDLCAIGVGFSCQMVDEVPVEAHDCRMSGLVIAGALERRPA